jgi:hypothetical protein
VADIMNPSVKHKLFWLLLLLLMAAFVYGSYRFLLGEVFDLSLWQKLIEDPDHRWKPYAKEDINGDGIRSQREAGTFSPEHYNIIFSGDSYVYGHLLSAEQAPPMQFEKLAQQALPKKDIQVANFGWSSSSPYLSLRLLKDIGKKYHPDLVIFLLDATDYKDDFFYRHVIEKRGAYKFIVEHPLLAHFPRKIARKFDRYTHWQEKWLGYPDFSTYFLFHQPYEKSVPFFDNTYEILRDMNQFVTEELHAKFIVFISPRHWQYTDKESPLSWERHNYTPMGKYVLNNFIYFESKQKTAPFTIVPLLEDFKHTDVFPTTFEKDSHWNPAGAKFAAETIFKHCQELGCFD